MTTATIALTRTQLSLTNLELNDPTNGYTVVASGYGASGGQAADRGPDPGAIVWRRINATSPFLHGAVQINAVMDLAKSTIDVLVTASDHATLQARIAVLIQGLTQTGYSMIFGLDGTAYSWNCYQADYAVIFDEFMVTRRYAHVKASIPRQPVSVQGPI